MSAIFVATFSFFRPTALPYASSWSSVQALRGRAVPPSSRARIIASVATGSDEFDVRAGQLLLGHSTLEPFSIAAC
jgi:hypothetical protein